MTPDYGHINGLEGEYGCGARITCSVCGQEPGDHARCVAIARFLDYYDANLSTEYRSPEEKSLIEELRASVKS